MFGGVTDILQVVHVWGVISYMSHRLIMIIRYFHDVSYCIYMGFNGGVYFTFCM